MDQMSSDNQRNQNQIANQIENPNLNLNEFLKDQNSFLTYDENGQLIIIENDTDLIYIEPKGKEEPFEIDLDEFEDNYNNDNYNNESYKGNFNLSNNSLNSSGNKFGFFKRSSMTVSDLTDDSKLRKSISVGDEVNVQLNYIEVSDWEFEKEENREKFENVFQEFENKFFSKSKYFFFYSLKNLSNNI